MVVEIAAFVAESDFGIAENTGDLKKMNPVEELLHLLFHRTFVVSGGMPVPLVSL